jgi:hypothetical protein
VVATSKDATLNDGELDTVVGGIVTHKTGASSYNKKNVTTYPS